MLRRKIEPIIETHLSSADRRILLIDGARQVGKTFSVRRVGNKLFENFVEINLVQDALGERVFADVHTVSDFYLALSVIAGKKLHSKENTLVFLDEIQNYPHLLTLLKFLSDDARFSYIASGSLLGVTLAQTSSIPMGSIRRVRMYPLDFEEFLWANDFSSEAIDYLHEMFEARQPVKESVHHMVLNLFRKYLFVGGLPQAVDTFKKTGNIVSIREVQNEIREYYAADAAKYDEERKLVVRRIYDMLPSNMERQKKRVIVKSIEGKKGKTFQNYRDEFEYLTASGIALEVQAVSNPRFPLSESGHKNLLKLYLNDPGLLSAVLYEENIFPILHDNRSVNLGALYETAVACTLAAGGSKLFYYDNRSKGEVDFLLDDFSTLSAVPIEVKSGKDYTVHNALSAMTKNMDYGISKAFVLSNTREIRMRGTITYLPVYFAIFLTDSSSKTKYENIDLRTIS